MIINFDEIVQEFMELHGSNPDILDVGHSQNLLRVIASSDEIIPSLPQTFTHTKTAYEIGIEYTTLDRVQKKQAWEAKEKAARELMEAAMRDAG